MTTPLSLPGMTPGRLADAVERARLEDGELLDALHRLFDEVRAAADRRDGRDGGAIALATRAERTAAAWAPIAARLERAQREDEVRADLPLAWLLSQTHALLVVAVSGDGAGADADDDLAAVLVDALQHGVRARR